MFYLALKIQQWFVKVALSVDFLHSSINKTFRKIMREINV